MAKKKPQKGSVDVPTRVMAETFKASGLFTTGFELEEVLAIQAQAKKDVLAGRDITGYSDSGKNVSKTRNMPVGQVLVECAYALKALDPAKYGRNRTGRRVHANFNTRIYL